MSKKFIDTEELIRSKNPGLLKKLPRFVLNYIKRTIHENDVNDFMEKNKDKQGVDFCTEVITSFNIEVELLGEANIPPSGGVIFACNHPLGGMDAMAIVYRLKHLRNDIKFIVNDVLLHLTNLKNIFVGVNKYGKNASSSLKTVEELFSSDHAIFIFPAGLVSRRKKGIIEDLEWKKTVVTQAVKNNKTIVPVYIDGKLSNFFYNLSRFRECIGIKSNIELFYLPDETFKQKNKKIRLIFGKPIPSDYFSSEKSDSEWAQELKNTVYALKSQIK
jgi:putative hemolysin